MSLEITPDQFEKLFDSTSKEVQEICLAYYEKKSKKALMKEIELSFEKAKARELKHRRDHEENSFEDDSFESWSLHSNHFYSTLEAMIANPEKYKHL